MNKTILSLVVLMSFWGCATFSQNYKLGTQAALNKNWDTAVLHYERAYAENPGNSAYRIALERAKISASLVHLYEARNLMSADRKEEALAEYEKSLFFNSSKLVADEAKSAAGIGPEKEEKAEVRIEAPVKLKAGTEPIELRFRQQTSLRSIFQALGKSAGINIIFDELFREISYSFDLVDKSFEQAVNLLCIATKNFYIVIDEETIIIAPDQPAKRNQYELNAVRTFYLSNISAEEIQGNLSQILRTPYKAPTIIVDKNLNSVTVRDAPAILELAERILRIWDKAKGEVIIDVEIMEASRTKLRQLGLDVDPHTVAFGYTGGSSEEGISLGGIDFSNLDNFQITLPAVYLDFLESDMDTKIIDQPRLRGLDGEEIRYVVGDEVPIPRTSFQPIATGGFGQNPLTSFEYKNVGIEILLTPRLHREDEVTLEVDIKIKSLGEAGYADIPMITSREVQNTIRLKDGETNLLAGLLKDEERKTLKGIAGIKSLPILGSLFSNTNKSIQQSEVVLTITPYIIRPFKVTEEDTDPLWINLQGTSPAGPETQRLAEEDILDEEMRRARLVQERERAAAEEVFNTISLSPGNFEVPQNREFRISINMRSQQEFYNMSLNLSFDSTVLNLKNVSAGGFVRQQSLDASFLQNVDNASGTCTIAFSSPDIARSLKGAGGIAVLLFESRGQGESVISIDSVAAVDTLGNSLAFQTGNSRVIVR